MRSKLYILLLLVVLPFVTFSQEETINSLDEIVEEIASSSDAELDYTSLFQALEELYYNPLDLNSASEDDLKDMLFLTEFQIYSLVKYRQKFGAYKTLYELQFVDGIDGITLKRLLPFVTVQENKDQPTTDLAKLFGYGMHTGFVRYQRLLQEKAGYDEIPDSVLSIDPDKSRYLGSPDKLYYRHTYKYKDRLFYGITMEKDDGEQFFKGAQKYGFDYYSGHFQINKIGVIKKLIVGDFTAQFGQGMTMWSGMSFGKTSSSTNIIKKARGINKYSSVNESAFFRGQAMTLQFGKFNFTEFVSYKSLDAGIDTVSFDGFDEEEQYVSSFLESGYHRTPSEVAKRKTIKEFVTGANLNWAEENFRIGATGVYYGFSQPIVGNSAVYRYFDFSGTENANFGVDYLVSVQKVKVFGETSMSSNLGWASVNGAVFDFVPEFKMSVVHRYLRQDYQALYAQPFSEGNKPNNETGLFIGTEIFPKKNWKVSAYFDSWKYPWLRYGVGGPSSGNEYLVQVTHFPQRNLEVYFRMKYETKQKNDPDTETGVRPLSDYSSSKYRLHMSYTANNEWKLRSRAELARYSINGVAEWGYTIYQDFVYKPAKLPLTFNARIAVFETESYNTRIYAYEPDILYGFSIPAYYGQGSRLIFVVKYSATDNLDFWFRIANTYYADQTDLGSGLDAIEGNNRTDIKLQLRYKF
jgi:hypothetical protein